MPGDALDRATVDRLFVRLERPLFNVVYRWLWSVEDAREVVQEAFVRLWRMRDRVDVARVEPLVYRIAINLASNRRRRRRVLQWVGLEREPIDDAAPMARRQSRALLRNAVDDLPEKLRQVVVLTELAEMSYADVAASLHIPVGTVGSRRNTALGLLRDALGDPLGGELR